MAELCERCTSGLTCSAAEAEDRARVAAEEVIKTGPTQYTPPPARPAAMPRAAPVTNPWQVPSPTRYTPPAPSPPADMPRAAPETFARTTYEARRPADYSYNYDLFRCRDLEPCRPLASATQDHGSRHKWVILRFILTQFDDRNMHVEKKLSLAEIKVGVELGLRGFQVRGHGGVSVALRW